MRNTLSSLALVLAMAAPAAAQEEGVTVDPSSPSGREYSLPFEEAREQGKSGSARKQDGGKQGGAAFGEGVEGSTTTPTTPQQEGSRDSGGDAPKKRSEQRERDDAAGAAGGDDQGPSAPQATAREASSAGDPGEGGSGEMLAVGAIGSGILVLGGVCGLLVRRRILSDSP